MSTHDSRIKTLSRDLMRTDQELAQIRREKEELTRLEKQIKESEDSLQSNEGSFIEHPTEEMSAAVGGGGGELVAELAFLMGEVQRVAGLQEKVMRKLEQGGLPDEATDEDQSVSFERDEELPDTGAAAVDGTMQHNRDGQMIDESVRNEILDEFDNVIDKNEFIDAELLQALLERLWNVTSEAEKQYLIEQLNNEDPAGDGARRDEEQPSEVALFEALHTSLDALAGDCAEDVAKVENAIRSIERRARDLCESELPFTVFNSHLLGRLEEGVTDAIRMHRLNLLMDSALKETLHQLFLRFERMPVQENVASLVSDVSDLLYDEMLFANLYMKQTDKFEDISARLRREARMVESRLERLQRAQNKQQDTLMKERRVRLQKLNISRDTSFGDFLDPIDLHVSASFDAAFDDVIAQSPGGQFAASPNSSARYSPTARRGLIDYEQLLAETTPSKDSRSATLVNKSLIENYTFSE